MAGAERERVIARETIEYVRHAMQVPIRGLDGVNCTVLPGYLENKSDLQPRR